MTFRKSFSPFSYSLRFCGKVGMFPALVFPLAAQAAPTYTAAQIQSDTTVLHQAVDNMPLTLDPGNPVYGSYVSTYIQTQFQGTGVTPSSAPALMAAAKGNSLNAKARTGKQLQATSGGQVSDVFDLLDVAYAVTGNVMTVNATGLFSAWGNATVSGVAMVIVDKNTWQPMGQPVATAHMTSNYVTLHATGTGTITGSSRPDPIAVLTVVAIPNATCSDLPMGWPRCYSRMAAASATLSASPYAQTLYVSISGLPASQPIAKAPKNGNDTTTLCLGRNSTAQNTNCTYIDSDQSNGRYQGLLRVPAVGSVVLSDSNPVGGAQPKIAGFTSYILPTATGGGCTQMQTTSTASAFSAVGQTVAWNFGDTTQNQPGSRWVQYGSLNNPAPTCWTSGGTYSYVFNFTVVDTKNDSIPVFVNNTDTPPPAGNEALVSPLSITYGCIAAQTPVPLANGQTKPASEIQVGDTLLAGSRAKQRGLVVNTYIGNEFLPMIQLATSTRAILVTEGHPILTPKGMVEARHLKVGSKVETVDGVETLVTARPVPPSKGKSELVFNFDVTALSGKRKDPSYVAGGFLNGDNRVQIRLARANEAQVHSHPKYAPKGFEAEHRLSMKLHAKHSKDKRK